MKVIDRILKRLTGSPLEQQCREANRDLAKRYSQNCRILTEFPWLWAAHHTWELATDVVIIVDSKQFDLSGEIAVEMKHHHKRIPQLWGHFTMSVNGRPLESVDQVWGGGINKQAADSNPKLTWDELLRTSYHQQGSLLLRHVVVVQDEPTRIFVIRPPKPFQSFNEVWAWHSLRN